MSDDLKASFSHDQDADERPAHLQHADKLLRYLFQRGNPKKPTSSGSTVKVTEGDAQKVLECSRQTARETLFYLLAQGIGPVEKQSGFSLAIPRLAEVHEIHELRLLLETEVCSILSQRALGSSWDAREFRDETAEVLNPIHEDIKRLAQALADDEQSANHIGLADDLWMKDSEFHAALAGQAGRYLTGNFVRIIRDRLRFVLTPQKQIIERAPVIVRQHEAIIFSLTKPELAEVSPVEALQHHLMKTNDFIQEAARELAEERGRKDRKSP